MFTIKGKDEDAIVYANKDDMDPETLKQIARIVDNPAVSHCRIMPDCHMGTGCCVGMTCLLGQKVIPRIIGGDIACGIATYPIDNSLNKFKRGRYEKKFDTLIQKLVPMGHNVHEEPVIQEAQYVNFFVQAKDQAMKFAASYKQRFGLDITDCIPDYSTEWMKSMCDRVGSDYNYDLRCMMTLGSGNHFIEVGEVGEVGEDRQDRQDRQDSKMLYLTVHTGSRNIGMMICRYHQDKASRRLKEGGEEWLIGQDAYEYFFDMIFAQMYAKINRRAIISSIVCSLGLEFKSDKIIESVHNYVDFDDMVVRKGAIRAHEGEQCIIALNMRDGILICKGKGNPEWNQSSAHGCGRIVSRNRAKNKFTIKQYKESMKDVYSTCVNIGTIDEAPMAYKDSEMIMSTLGPSVEILTHVRATLNIKAQSI